ncbi:MAG: hypothetical protein ACHBN1_26610 [Heteroscytonema crispum UTEX LB 1556]
MASKPLIYKLGNSWWFGAVGWWFTSAAKRGFPHERKSEPRRGSALLVGCKKQLPTNNYQQTTNKAYRLNLNLHKFKSDRYLR